MREQRHSPSTSPASKAPSAAVHGGQRATGGLQPALEVPAHPHSPPGAFSSQAIHNFSQSLLASGGIHGGPLVLALHRVFGDGLPEPMCALSFKETHKYPQGGPQHCARWLVQGYKPRAHNCAQFPQMSPRDQFAMAPKCPQDSARYRTSDRLPLVVHHQQRIGHNSLGYLRTTSLPRFGNACRPGHGITYGGLPMAVHHPEWTGIVPSSPMSARHHRPQQVESEDSANVQCAFKSSRCPGYFAPSGNTLTNGNNSLMH